MIAKWRPSWIRHLAFQDIPKTNKKTLMLAKNIKDTLRKIFFLDFERGFFEKSACQTLVLMVISNSMNTNRPRQIILR